MLEDNTTFSINDYIEIALRRKWLIILPILIIIPITIVLSYVLPKAYKAETTILVIPQNIPDSFVKSTVTMNPSEYLTVISQEILSRTHLEKVIQRISPDLLDKLPLDILIATMRKNIQIDVKRRRDRDVASFSISYIDKDPYVAAEAPNLMANLFIEENLRRREQQAKKTTEFLTNELHKLKVILEEQEAVLSEFKQRYIGSLPEQRDSNLRMLDQLITQQQRISDEINDLENRKILIQQQLMQSESIHSLNSNQEQVVPTGSLQSRISLLKRKIAELQTKYTEEYPDVIAAQTELQKLLTQAYTTEVDSEDHAPGGSSTDDNQTLAINLRIKSLKNEDAQIQSKIAEYQSKVEMAPKLEQQLFSITRDYENTQEAYDELIRKRMDAEQSEKLELSQQGEQFKVLDLAKVPTTPFKPNRMKVLFMGIMFALAVGGGLVFLAEFLDQSFHNAKSLESYLELPVLASIPIATTENREIIQNINK